MRKKNPWEKTEVFILMDCKSRKARWLIPGTRLDVGLGRIGEVPGIDWGELRLRVWRFWDEKTGDSSSSFGSSLSTIYSRSLIVHNRPGDLQSVPSIKLTPGLRRFQTTQRK